MAESSENATPTIYRVVVNHEEQYSIWPTYKELPLGWSEGGPVGPKAECLAYIEEVWTDMRPLSLRQAMARAGDGEGASGADSG
jgi:MbtH protein